MTFINALFSAHLYLFSYNFSLLHSLLFLNLGEGEVFIIILVIVLFFGSKNLPQLARGLGRGIREFKDATNSIQKEIKDSVNTIQEEVQNNTQSIQREINKVTDISPSPPQYSETKPPGTENGDTVKKE